MNELQVELPDERKTYVLCLFSSLFPLGSQTRNLSSEPFSPPLGHCGLWGGFTVLLSGTYHLQDGIQILWMDGRDLDDYRSLTFAFPWCTVWYSQTRCLL